MTNNNIFDSDKVIISPSVLAREKVENLTDRPNNNEAFGGDGMTPLELKKQFDKIGIYLASKLRSLVDAIKSADAGSSIGIKDWSDNTSTIKEMLTLLTESQGASIIGSSKVIEGTQQNLQTVIDHIYSLIESYELDDIKYIKDGLFYNDSTGELELILDITRNLVELNELSDKLKELLSANEGVSSLTRIDEIEGDVSSILEKISAPLGIATLDGDGKIIQSIDATKISGGTLPLSVIPDAAFERTKEVASTEDLLSLTYLEVQNGDIVIIGGNPDKWYKVINDKVLGSMSAFREIIGGTTAVSQMAREYDGNYQGANSIKKKFDELSEKDALIEEETSELRSRVAPLEEDNRMSKQDIESLKADKANVSVIESLSIPSGSWTGTDLPYTFVLTNSKITATSVQEIFLKENPTEAEVTAFSDAKIADGGQEAGKLYLKAYGDKPMITLPLKILYRGDV